MLGRINNKAAFTIAEVLVAILIMLMVSSIMVAGIPAAKRAYEGTVAVSNAEVLLSTTISALRGKLGTATSVRQETNNTGVIFYSSDTHSESRIYLGSDGMILYNETYPGSDGFLVPEKAIDKDQYVTYQSVRVEGAVVTFHGLVVKSTNGTPGNTADDTVLADTLKDDGGGDISIRTLSGTGQ